MKKRLGHITLLVNDYEETLDFYQQKLGFVKVMDAPMGPDLRWITIAPEKDSQTQIALVKADTDEKRSRVGSQVGNHVFIVLQTDDVEGDYHEMMEKGVKFFGEPRDVPWGKEVVFSDLYGNRWDLLQLG